MEQSVSSEVFAFFGSTNIELAVHLLPSLLYEQELTIHLTPSSGLSNDFSPFIFDKYILSNLLFFILLIYLKIL